MVVLILMVVYILVGALFVGISIPLVQGRIKPNPWYGFRVKKTLRDPETWYAVNAYSGRRMVVLGAAVAIAGVVFSPLGLIPKSGIPLYVFVCHGILLGGLAWILMDTLRYLRKF